MTGPITGTMTGTMIGTMTGPMTGTMTGVETTRQSLLRWQLPAAVAAVCELCVKAARPFARSVQCDQRWLTLTLTLTAAMFSKDTSRGV